MNKFTLTTTFALALITNYTNKVTASNAKLPNIIFILSDDGGYADWGFQGSKQFKTPNLDAMAKKGVILEQAYTTDAVSGPSRAGLMTGRYQQRFGIEENPVTGLMSESSKCLGKDMCVPADEKFIPYYLNQAGYKCASFGKWHLGGTDETHPFAKGYEHFIGFRSGGRDYYRYTDEQLSKQGFNSENRMEYGIGDYREPDGYVTDLLADEACKYVEKNKNNPFFIYLAFNAVHAPLQIDQNDKDLFPEIEDPYRRKLATMAFSMDRALGRLFDTLKKNGLDENTIIVFGNDNGGPNGTHTSNYPLRGMKATFLEGGIRVPAFIVYPGVIEKNSRYSHPVSFMDFLPTFAEIAGVDIPADAEIDGVDIIPYLTGKNNSRPHQTLYWKCENRGVVRDGDYKFMRFPDRPAELYDLSQDISEHNNIANQHPELMKKYYKMLFDWEMTLERPRWMLDRFCEKRVMEQFYEQKEYKNPMEQQ